LDKWTQILTEMTELSKANAGRGDRAFRVTVAWQRKVPLETRALVASAAWRAADAFSRNGIDLRGVMVLIGPYDAWPMALVGPRDLPAIPEGIRSFAAQHGAGQIVFAASGLTVLEPRIIEAVLAHEFAHVVLGHCNGGISARFLARCRWIRRVSVLRREMAADELAARLGYGPDLLEILRRFRGTGFWGRVEDGARKWNLRAAWGRSCYAGKTAAVPRC
jgi:Zn-dependent protease with chaperone function